MKLSLVLNIWLKFWGLKLISKIFTVSFPYLKELNENTKTKYGPKQNLNYARFGEAVVIYNGQKFVRGVCVKEDKNSEFYEIDTGVRISGYNNGMFLLPDKIRDLPVLVQPLAEKLDLAELNLAVGEEVTLKFCEPKQNPPTLPANLPVKRSIRPNSIQKLISQPDSPQKDDGFVEGNSPSKKEVSFDDQNYDEITICNSQCKFSELGFYVNRNQDEATFLKLNAKIFELSQKGFQRVNSSDLREEVGLNFWLNFAQNKKIWKKRQNLAKKSFPFSQTAKAATWST